jgi:hypothetical protein
LAPGLSDRVLYNIHGEIQVITIDRTVLKYTDKPLAENRSNTKKCTVGRKEAILTRFAKVLKIGALAPNGRF